ncbi:YfaP family protein [Tahibacter soli]|uniref:Tetratricopeptide repeat protein n=1 Tax=Tahibacter soli TaxID=2983605 RepID=A0A9X3YL13_9GAMM|nr:tetratricopeptide repeat protein [Tahibacter soli]MDC8013195.1 tetratricopeptide repeat protein [Tahibacter soli]
MKHLLRLAAPALLLVAGAAAADTIPVTVLSATVKDQHITNASVTVQRNGAASVEARTGIDGKATVETEAADDAESLLIIKMQGYSTLVARCPCKGLTYALSPVMKSLDGLRIVLTWGKKPDDVDSHVVYPGNHVYFASKQGADANLDVDDTDSYGPETITLEKKHLGETYLYAVHDYTDSDKPNTPNLSTSQAKVYVYIGQSLVRSYSVPTGKTGNLWTVFRINGDGEFQDINTMGGTTASGDALGAQLAQASGGAITAVAATTDAMTQAKELNRAGEAAYHAGNLDGAIDSYRSAIDLYPEYGQAYSNLGLAYQKAGRPAEAIWANRKAIALASGATAPTVRASSYYNIGKLYEESGQFADAQRSYEQAKSQKANPVYDKAIERVKGKQ